MAHPSRLRGGMVGSMAMAGLVWTLTPSAHAQLAGSAALTSDYVWRGSSQSRAKPAIQAGFKYAQSAGLYASVWGSNVRFKPDNGAAAEFNIALGWSGKVADNWSLDTYLLRYQYSGSHSSLNWNEVNIAATWRNNYSLAVGHSTNAMASNAAGTYALITARFPFRDRWRLESSLAQYVLAGAPADSYSHGSVAMIAAWKAPLELRLALHGSDRAARRLFSDMAGTRAELAMQASF